MKFYEFNSIPLRQITWDDLEDGQVYVNDEGHKVRYNEENFQLEIIQNGELSLGNTMEDVKDPKLLKTYWQLMFYNSPGQLRKRNRENGNTGKD